MIPSVFKISTLVLFLFVQSPLCIDVKLLKESVPVAVGVMLEADKRVVSEKCFEDIQVILQGISDRQLWALQILDSSGNRPSAFLWGDNFWIGYRQSCITSNKPTLEEMTKRLPHEVLDIPSPVTVDYRILSGSINFKEQKTVKVYIIDSSSFHFGICIPTSCSFNETNYISQKYFGKGFMSSFFKATVNFKHIQDFNQTTADLWSNFSYQAFVLLIVTLTILSLLSGRNATLRSCFHFPSNLLATLSTRNNPDPDSIPSLAAFKTVSCLWIVGMHVSVFNLVPFRVPLMTDILDHSGYNMFFRAVTATDIFSLISGLLLSYNFLRNIKLQDKIKGNTFIDNCKLYLSLILHRYLRLAPVVLVSIIISKMAYLYLDSINSQMGGCPGIQCQNWIYNMLFAQNLLPGREMCHVYSWQIASDFQLYGIFMMILFIQTKYSRLGRSMLIFVTTGGVLLTFILCIYYDFKLTVLDCFNSFDTVYKTLYSRVHIFGIGVIVGIILKRVKDTNIPSFERKTIQIYMISTLLPISVLGMMAKSTNLIFSAFIWSVFRFIYTMAFGSYICLAQCGYLNILTDLGASSFCQRVFKVSYPLYVIHSIIARLAFGGRLPPSDISYPMTVVSIVGVAGITFVISVICTAAVEIPFQNLSRQILKRSYVRSEVTANGEKAKSL
ncbi:Acyltransferase 3 domain [Sergentomyia squamirostris]